MNVGNALGFPAPTPVAKRSDAPKAADNGDATPATARSAQFSAFLTMIVGNDPKLRSDLQKQLPADSAGLLDRLLSSASGGDSDVATAVDSARYGLITDAARGPGVAATNAAPRTDLTAATKAQVGTVDTAVDENIVATTGVIKEPIAKTDTNSTIAPTAANNKLTRAEINAINKARAAELLGSMQFNGDPTPDIDAVTQANAQSRIPQSILAKVTSRKTPALEELLAVGDNEAASVRVGLDNVLAKSGTDEGMKLAANHAANTALNAALAASANDVATPIKDVAALDPELRGRLERVIDRMKNEYGHDVTVVETARSQERQDSLYAQGRTTPGSVVTWTDDSLHTQGKAVDVVVDGTWTNPKGFARLQQVAKEEGLNTLGTKDPGHLELPKESWSLNPDVRVTSATSNVRASNGIAQVATVARVASVGAGMNISPTKPELPAIPAVPHPNVQTNGAAGLLPQQRDTNSGANSQSSADGSHDQSSKKSSVKSTDKTDARAVNNAYQDTPTDAKKFIGPVDETQRSSSATAADAVDRVHDINTLREQQGAKPLSQMTLEVEDSNGGTQQIKVDVRGNVVDTQISAGSVSADRMRTHVSELKTGLESRGLESDSVRISTQNARTEGLEGVKHSAGAERDVMRMTGAGTSGGASNGDQAAQQGTRDKSSATRDWEDKQATRDEQRAQNRDAQGRGSGNQDRQRPQYQEKK